MRFLEKIRLLIRPKVTSIHSNKLPFRIVPGGKESNDNQSRNGGNGGVESGDMIVEGWKEKHASDSEAIIKAERYVHKNGTEELQKLTVEHFEKNRDDKIIHLPAPDGYASKK